MAGERTMRYTAGVAISARTPVSKLPSFPRTAHFQDISRWFFHCQQMSSLICISRVLLKRALDAFIEPFLQWIPAVWVSWIKQEVKPRAIRNCIFSHRWDTDETTHFKASRSLFPLLQVWAYKQVPELSSFTELQRESWCSCLLFSLKLRKQTSAIPTNYTVLSQKKRNDGYTAHKTFSLSFSFIRQRVNKSSRHTPVKFRVLTAWDVVIKETVAETGVFGYLYVSGRCEWVRSVFFLHPHEVHHRLKIFFVR